MLGGAASPGGEDLLTVTVARDEHGYGMKVSGDNPVYVQSVKEHGAAWRAGLRAGDRILRVDAVPVHRHTHQQVVQMIRASPATVLTVQQNTSRHKTPITAPVPVNPEKQRQLEVSKVYTMRLMLEQEQKYIRDLRNELCKVPDVRKQTQLESAELRCSKLQHEIDALAASQDNSGLFSNLRSVRESRARTAVLLNWLLGERRCACANLLLILTDAYRNAAGVSNATLRRWAYEIQSTFLIPSAVLQLNGVDENMANEIEHVLVNEYEKEELLRNVFRKARQKAKEELSQQLSEFQVKRQVGLGTLYGPEDSLLEKCDVDKAQYVVRGHHLQLQALTSVAHCHHCDHVIWGLAPQCVLCTDCKLRVHRNCAKSVEEGCCLDGDHHNNRISRFMERIHNNQPNNLDFNDKKSRKSSSTGHFLNMERSFRKQEDDIPWDQTLTPASSHGEPKREGSADEPPAPEADVDTNDTTAKDTPDKDNNWRAPPAGAGGPGRGVNRAESCRERDAPRRGGKHRNASDPNRLTAHNNHDLEPGAVTAPSGSSSSSSLSSRSNESNTVAADQQASQSEWSDEEEPLAPQWADSLPAHVLDSLQLSSRLRKRQEVIHEMIVSEGSHVRWLKVLCRVFLRPLESAPALLPPDDLKALFPNLPEVRDWHQALHQRLRAARNAAPAHQLSLRALAQALLGTLGEPSYAASLSRFCRGQRLALESLRERRRKNKELHQFLSSREQLPLCGRLQLRDLLACVWQRLTKYRLLLESVLKTVSEDEDSAEDVELLQKSLDSAKDMLLSVDQAIRTTENEHRLRNIQAKLEVRANGNEWEELRRLELHTRNLRLEGELTLRLEQHKRTAVIALMFPDMLVLLLREGERFVLRPLPHQHGLLSPIIKWDKVLFRPNAAVRNTFFLMNINGVQMHELSANTAAEYTTWVNCIQEAPLARVELKQTITPSHQPSRSTDDEGVNVSRNPSDASEKSNPVVTDEPESDKDGTPAPIQAERDNTPVPAPTDNGDEEENTDSVAKEKEDSGECEEKIAVGGVGRVLTQAAPRLIPAPSALPSAEAHVATTVCTYTERLRRLDEGIEAALRAKAAIVGEVLGVPAPMHQHLSELAIADTLGQVDVRSELRATRQSSVESSDEDGADCPDIRQLLLAAHAQANQLTEAISRALVVNEAAALAARDRRGRCDRCRIQYDTPESSERVIGAEVLHPSIEKQVEDSMAALQRGLRGETIPPTEVEGDVDRALERSASAAMLAARLSSLSGGLQGCVRGLLQALPALDARATDARTHLAAAREREHCAQRPDYQMTDEIYFLKPDAEQPIQDQPSNGG
ncbi:hypothetical protein evm_003512 [Chilo suppressalis]|nr:hypothetical protein evm_003512 [Chilo suppressalis]